MTTNETDAKPLVVVRHVSYQYPAQEQASLRNVSFEVFPTDRILLVGANGSGKSTLLSLLAGARKPQGSAAHYATTTIVESRAKAKEMEATEGKEKETGVVTPPPKPTRQEPKGYIRVMGEDPFNVTSMATHITLIGAPWPCEAIFGNTVEKVVSIPANTPPESVPAVIKRRAHLAAALHLSLSRYVDQMSAGERRRVQVLHGLLPEATLFLLDECSTDIDVVERKTVLDWVKEEVIKRNGACVYATHVLDGVEEWATHVALMRGGELVEYLPLSSFFQQYKKLEDGEVVEAVDMTTSLEVSQKDEAGQGERSFSLPSLPSTSHHSDPYAERVGSLRQRASVLKISQKKNKKKSSAPTATAGESCPTARPASSSSAASSSTTSVANVFFHGDEGFSLENFARDFMSASAADASTPVKLPKALEKESNGAHDVGATPASTGAVWSSTLAAASPVFPRRYSMEGVTCFLSETIQNAASPTMGAAPSCQNYREVSVCNRRRNTKNTSFPSSLDRTGTSPVSQGTEEEEDAAVLFATVPAIECTHLTYKHVFSDMSFSIPQGARVLLCGCNGSGKSTLLHMLGGKQFFPNGNGALQILGYPCYDDMRVMNGLVAFGGDWWPSPPKGEVYVREMLDLITTRAHYLRELLSVDMDWNVQNLSSGESRRVQLLHQLLEDKPVVLLDEATSDLDVDQRHRLLSFLYAESVERGVTVVYATHIFNGLDGWPTMTMIMDGTKKGVHGVWYRKCDDDDDDDDESNPNDEGKNENDGKKYGMSIKEIPIELKKLKEMEVF